MKKYLIVLFLLFSLRVYSQEIYTILHIKGKITLKSTGHEIQQGDKVSANEEILFSSKTDMSAAVSSKSGRIILRPVIREDNSSELGGFVKDIVTSATGKLSSRGVMGNSLDLQNHFQGDYLVLGGRSTMQLNSTAFPMDEKTFFYVRYIYRDDIINKKLSSVGDSLILDGTEIYKIDDVTINMDSVDVMELFYYDSEWKTSQRINSFRPYFPSDADLLPSIQILIEALKEGGMGNEKIKEEVEAHLSQVYGKFYSQNFDQWIRKNFDL